MGEFRDWWKRRPGWTDWVLIALGAIVAYYVFGWANEQFGGSRPVECERVWNSGHQEWEDWCYEVRDPDLYRDPRD